MPWRFLCAISGTAMRPLERSTDPGRAWGGLWFSRPTWSELETSIEVLLGGGDGCPDLSRRNFSKGVPRVSRYFETRGFPVEVISVFPGTNFQLRAPPVIQPYQNRTRRRHSHDNCSTSTSPETPPTRLSGRGALPQSFSTCRIFVSVREIHPRSDGGTTGLRSTAAIGRKPFLKFAGIHVIRSFSA